MKFNTFSNILIICILICFFYVLLFVPFKWNYTINSINESTGIMDVTYSSPIPFTKVDTTVFMPKYFYGKVLYNYHKVENNQNIYRTAIQVGSEIYTYKTIDTYHYVKEFMNGKDSVKLIEIFWPEHIIKTLSIDGIYNRYNIKNN